MADHDKLLALSSKTYKEQAIWFLNAFWAKYGSEAEKVWTRVHEMVELDERKKEGNGLDEMMAHRFLEKLHETMTVQSMRDKLRQSQALGPQERPKVVPLIHYLIIHYNADWRVLVNAPQGNEQEIAKAQRMLDEVNAAFADADEKAQEAAAAFKRAKAAESDAKAKEDYAKRTAAAALQAEQEALEVERPFKEAQEELERALADMHRQEDEYKARTEDLKRKSEEGGAVQRNKAKAELEIHLKEDPLPLRKAKITTEAAERKADKLRAPFKAARESAEQARAEAEQSRQIAEAAANKASKAREAASAAARQSEKAKAAAEEALEEATRKVQEAEEYLEEAKKRVPEGSIWWLQRELAEAKKYLPSSKGGVKK